MNTTPPATPTLDLWYEVDPIFRAFYSYLGGKNILGPVISPAIKEGNLTVQFIEAGKMVFDPQAPAKNRFTLAALGKIMDINEPPVPPPTQPGVHYACGHIIYPDFIALYESLGERNVGCPLTEARYNPFRKRYEQFFENLGLYRLEGSIEVRLLSYGAMICDKICGPPKPTNGDVDVKFIDPVFKGFVNKMGMDFTGFAVSDAYWGKDGGWEQILENLVVALSPNTNSISVRPLSKEVNIVPQAPKPYNGNQDNFFYAIQGDLGYEIPAYIWDYIVQHGGVPVSGPPITHFVPLGDHTYRQCFANLCLVYETKALEGVSIRPEALGYAYKSIYYTDQLQTPQFNSGRDITLWVWESNPAIDSSQSQEIGVLVSENFSPLPEIVPILVVTMPDGSRQGRMMPPTNVGGKSYLRLQPIQAQNSTLIPYQVCILKPDGGTLCIADSFIIWNNP
jgi:hypothetical protein